MENSAGPIRYMLNTWLRGVMFLNWMLPEWDGLGLITDNEERITSVFSDNMKIRYEAASNRGMALAQIYTYTVDKYLRSLTEVLKFTLPETVDMYWRNMNAR